jgi:serine/threonine protein phosphatase PrpC
MVGLTFEHIPLLAQLPAGERAELAASLQTFSLPAGALLIREGDGGDRFYMVVDGLDSAGQPIAIAHGRGQLLGLLPDPDLDEQLIDMPPGGRLLLCTDGVFDAVNAAGEQFSREGLLATAQRTRASTAQSLCDRVQAEVLAFQGEEAQFDDITLVVVPSEST